MQRTVRLRIHPTPEQATILINTMQEYDACFNAVADYGWQHGEKNGVELHKATYYPLRSEHPTLPSQLVCTARVRATEAVKSVLTRKKQGRKASCPCTNKGIVRYDAKTYRLLKDRSGVSMSTTSGRQIIPLTIPAFYRAPLDAAEGFDSADLIRHKGHFWLHVVITLAAVEYVTSGEVVGVDIGLRRPAVLSTNAFLGQRRWRGVDDRYFRLKRKLQAKGTRSAKRHLKRLAGKLLRLHSDCDHVLSKRIVQSIDPGTTIVFENLDDIRNRVRQRRGAQNRRLHSWSFRQLLCFTTYKAEEQGIRVIRVDPRNTSKMCSVCGSMHRSNRRSQSEFHCRACGFQLNADLNAARNLAERGKTALCGLPSISLSSQVSA